MTRLESGPPFTYGQQALLALGRLQGHALKSMMSYQIEALSFLKHRCEEDVKLIDELNSSQEMDQAVHVCASFFQNALNDYSSETGKLANIGSRLASETVTEMQKDAERLTDKLAKGRRRL